MLDLGAGSVVPNHTQASIAHCCEQPDRVTARVEPRRDEHVRIQHNLTWAHVHHGSVTSGALRVSTSHDIGLFAQCRRRPHGHLSPTSNFALNGPLLRSSEETMATHYCDSRDD